MEELNSVFLEREGATPKNKVLDFLVVHQEFDYSLKDIAKYAKISYPCMKQLKKELVKDNWIVMTRKVGKAQMYRLNIRNGKVEKFVGFFWSVVNEEIDFRLGLHQTDTNTSSTSTAVPISTRGI